MLKKKNPEPEEKSPIEKKIEVMMGPTPEEAPAQPAEQPVQAVPVSAIPTSEPAVEPTSAPIIPTEALPKEIIEERPPKTGKKVATATTAASAAPKKTAKKATAIKVISDTDESTDEAIPPASDVTPDAQADPNEPVPVVPFDPEAEPAEASPAEEEEQEEPITIPDVEETAEPEAESVSETDSDTEPEPEPTVEAASEPETEENSDESEDQAIDDAVDDIRAQESESTPTKNDIAKAKTSVPPKQPFLKRFFKVWWHNRFARWVTILLLLAGIVGAMVYPTSRYYVLNTAGVRASASVTVYDNSTQQPLKNVQVQINGQVAKTDSSGKVTVSHIKLGPSQVEIMRLAFATISKPVIIGWGSNPLGDFKLSPSGEQYTFDVTDFLSGKSVTKAEATSGEAEASADNNGRIVLTVDQPSDGDLQVTIKADTYRDEVITIDANNKNVTAVKMAPARKHVFISKRSGKYDLYSIDADGKNEKLLLSGTGNERADIALVPHPSANEAALVSTRNNVRNKDGYLLSTLTIINTNTGEKVEIGQSEKLQVVDWVGDRVVYVMIAAGASASNPQRHRLMSYDYKTEDKKEIASSNYFNDVVVADGAVYYAPSAAYQSSSTNFYKVGADGGGKQTLLNKEVWNIFRTQYDKLNLSVGQDWYEYKLGEVRAAKISGAPPDVKSRLYRDSPDKQNSLWVDNRDGKGVLVEYDITSKKDTVIKTQSGLVNPVYWLNNKYVVYRIHTDQETADYALNLDGGDPVKIRDVTNTAGVDQWYYYQ